MYTKIAVFFLSLFLLSCTYTVPDISELESKIYALSREVEYLKLSTDSLKAYDSLLFHRDSVVLRWCFSSQAHLSERIDDLIKESSGTR